MKRALIVLLALAGACSSDSGTAPHAGALTLRLAAGGSSDGAMVLTVSGGPVTSVDAPSGFQIASNADGRGTHIMVIGNLAAGAIATINVPDLARASAYVATIEQVSDRGTFALIDAARYQVTIGP